MKLKFVYNFLILVVFSCQLIGTVMATTYPVPYNQYNQAPYNTPSNQQTFSQSSNSSLNPFNRQKPSIEKSTSSKTQTQVSGGTCPRPSATDDGGQCKLNRCGGSASDNNQIPQIVDYVNRMNDDLNQLKISYVPSILHNVDGLDGKLRKLELDLRRLSEDMGNAPSQTDLKLLRGQIRDLKMRLNEIAASDPSSKADSDLENRLTDMENQLNYLRKRLASSEFKMPQQIDMNQIASIVENLVGQRFQIIDQRLNTMAQSQHIPAMPSPLASNTYEVSLPPKNVDLSPVYREVEQLKGYLQNAFHEIRLLQQQPPRTTVQSGSHLQDLEKLRRYVDEKINSLRHNFLTTGEKPKSENEAKINYALNQINLLMKKMSDLEHRSQMNSTQGYKGPSQTDIERIVKDIISLQITDLQSKLKEELRAQKGLTESDVRNIVGGILNNQNYKDIFEQIFSSKVSDITKLIQMEVSKVTTLSATDVKQMIDQAMSGINLESFKTEMNNSVKGELSAMKTEIEFLKAAPKGLSSQEIESLVQKMLMNAAGKADLDRLTQKIQTLESQLSSQQTSLSGLESMTSTINDLKSQIEVLRKNAGSTESSQSQNLTRVDQKLMSIEQNVNEMKNGHVILENKISSLEGYGPRLENVEKKTNDHDSRLQELERIVKEQGNLIQELSARPIAPTIETPVTSSGFKKGNYEDFYLKTEKPTVGKQLFSPKQVEVMCRQESLDQCRTVNCHQLYPGADEAFCTAQCTSGQLMHDQRENMYKVCMSERLQHQSEGLSPDKRMEWKNSIIPSFEIAAQQKMATGQTLQETSTQRAAMKGQGGVQPLPQPQSQSKPLVDAGIPTLEVKGQDEELLPSIPSVGNDVPVSSSGEVNEQQFAPPPPPPPPPPVPVGQSSGQTPVGGGGFKKGNYEDFYLKTEKPLIGKQLFSPKQIEVMCRQESFDQCRTVNCQQLYPGGDEKFCTDQCTSGKLMRDQRENLYKVCMSERLQRQSDGLSPDKRMDWKNSIIPSFGKAAQQKIATGQMMQQTSAQRVDMKGQMPVSVERPIVPLKKEQRAVAPQQQTPTSPVSTDVMMSPPPPPPPPPPVQKIGVPVTQENQTTPQQPENIPSTVNTDVGGTPPPPPPPPPPLIQKIVAPVEQLTQQDDATKSVQKNEDNLQKILKSRRKSMGYVDEVAQTPPPRNQTMLPQSENIPSNVNMDDAGTPPPPPPPPPPSGTARQNLKQPPVGLPPVSSKITAPVGQSNRGALLDQIRSRGGQGLRKTVPNEQKPMSQNMTGFNTGLADRVKENAGNRPLVENPNTASVGNN